MTSRSFRTALGSWVAEAGASLPRQGAQALKQAVTALNQPVVVVAKDGRFAVAEGGESRLGVTAHGEAWPLVAHVPALTVTALGDAGFREAHGVSYAYVAGEMANGIASEALVEAVARAGFLGVFGAAGLPIARIDQAMERLEHSLAGLPWGVNLIHSPADPALEAAAVELFLKRGLHFVSASAYLDLTLPIVKYRVAGIHRAPNGSVVLPNRVMAKVSRVEVARKFLEPAPERFLHELVTTGFITAEQAAWAATVPMADDVTAEADSGGHTDNRPLVLLLPALQALRDEVTAKHRYAAPPRVGAAGGLATPASVASAFSMGAAYVVTGSINQACVEAGTSDAVREMLAHAASTDVAMAPAADMFEMGVKVQVLTRGTLFAVRAQRLYELYRGYDSLEALPLPVRAELEQKFFRSTLEQAWAGCEAFFTKHDPRQLAHAANDPKHRLALTFRAYLGQASHWANDGVADRKLDYQIWCGPSMGAFNDWAKGSFLESWQHRRAVVIAKNLMAGAAVLTRVAALRSQGLEVPSLVAQFAPLEEAALDALLTEAVPEPAVGPVAGRLIGTTSMVAAPAEEPIAIVGMGSLFPKAENLTAFWRLLRLGLDAVTDVPASHWSVGDFYDQDPQAPDKTYAKRGAFLSPHAFDPTEFGIPPNVLEATDTSQLLSLVVARMAMEDAGYGEGVRFDRTRTSVLLGVTGTQELVISLGARLGHPRWKKALRDAGVDETTANDVVERISQSYVGWQENSFPGLLGNVIAGRIANRLDFGGTNCVIDAACASSLGAVHLAVLELRSKRSDMVLTGGVDCINDIFMHMCFSKTPALSASGDARPFSDQADGTLLGEGLGMLVLKRLSDAERDGDRIYATIRGIGTSSDGRAKSIYAPLPSGQARALTSAYQQANVRPRDIALVEAHGTGTKAGDAAEFEALNAVYRDDSPDAAWCALGSVKSQIGHTKAAAGAVGLMKAALSLHHKVFAPTLKVEKPNPTMRLETSPFTLSTETRPWLPVPHRPRLAAVSSFGFGGSNFHVVLEEHGSKRPAVAWDGSIELLAFSAPQTTDLVQQVNAARADETLTEFAARSRHAFRAQHPYRLIVVVPTSMAWSAMQLRSALERITRAPEVSFSTADGVHYGAGPAQGSLAFLFPGQGAQHVNMLRDLACIFPEMLEAVAATGELANAIYPPSTFDAQEKTRREERLTKTDFAQPAIGAVSRGAIEVLGRFGVKPALVAGHSYGELVALHAAGVLNAPALATVSKLRGALMGANGADRGTMLAVLAPLGDIEHVLAEEKLDVVLANRNGPAQGVLSGSRAEISRAEAVCQKRGLRTTRLPVGAAFHSPLVAGVAKAFRESLDDIAFGLPNVPIISNSTATRWPQAPAAIKDLLGQQLAMPVRFDAVVERLYDEGARTFVEVGPRSTLTGMVRAIVGSRPHVAMALDAQSQHGGLFDLAMTLARVAAAGHPVRLEAWQATSLPPRTVVKPARVKKMTVHLTGANYRAPFVPLPPRPVVPHAAPSSVLEALRVNQESVRALQAMHEQTARLHQSFLEGQLATQQAFQSLLRPSEPPRPPRVSTPLDLNGDAPKRIPHAENAEPFTPSEVERAAIVLQVVAEATGYPVETLSLPMQLEADLGIDSIKRVEILSMLSKRIPGAPSVNPEKLGSLKTLQQVHDFVATVPPSVGASTPLGLNGDAPHAENAKPFTPSEVEGAAIVLQVVAEATGYPVETLSLPMQLEADLGIDSIKRVEILSMLSKRIPGAPSVNPEKLGSLKTLQQVHDFVARSVTPPTQTVALTEPSARVDRRVVVATRLSPGVAAPFPKGELVVVDDGRGLGRALVDALQSAGHAARVIVTAADAPIYLGGLIVCSPTGLWSEHTERTLKNGVLLARALAPKLRERKGLFVAVSRRDGAFGHASVVPAEAALHGGLAGLVKSASHEWPEVRCKAIDVSSVLTVKEAATEIVRELALEAPLEVGLGPSGRVTLAMKSQPALPHDLRFEKGDVIVVTGGARGVTAECARVFAERHGVSLLLLGRSPEPTAEAAWLSQAHDEASIKRVLLEQAPVGQRPTPKQLGDACRAVLAAREIRASLQALESTGIRAHYRSVDVRDTAGLSAVLTTARQALGPLRGVIHGAGVLRDKRIEDKRDDDVDQVVDTKLSGLRALLEATATDDLRFIALFASVTGRFGRRGQSDYALANQALVSIAQTEAARRPLCRVVALDWGPWEAGMVTPALKAEFEREGVALIPLGAGALAFCQEVETAPGGPSEVVYGAGFGDEPKPEWALASTHHLDATWPVLRDHRLSGRAVLPLALSLEWFAQAAMHAHDGHPLATIEELKVLKGVTVGTSPEDVSIWVGPLETTPSGARAVLELRDAHDHVHIRAAARWHAAGPPPPRSLKLDELHVWPHTIRQAYTAQLFHGPSLEVLEAVEGIGPQGMRVRLRSPLTSSELIPGPTMRWVTNPLVVDGVFQAVILWCRAQRGVPSLPSRLGLWQQFRPFIDAHVFAAISIREVEGATVTADVEVTTAAGELVAKLEGYVCTMSATLDQAFAPEANATPSLITTA